MVRPQAWIQRKRRAAWQKVMRSRETRTRRNRTRPYLARWGGSRHSFGKETLCDFLFHMLDTGNIGALGPAELREFAMLTAFPTNLNQLLREIYVILDIYGSTHNGRFDDRRVSMLNFREMISTIGKLPMTKAEIRRTIRYASPLYPEIAGPRLPSLQWRSLKHMMIYTQSITWRKDLWRASWFREIYFTLALLEHASDAHPSC